MNLRNIAIIAHVDHGKTTLVDRCCSSPAPTATTSARSSARWIPTIWSASAASPFWPSAASVQWKDTRINIVDTPGHADFGGEVERILNMVDGVMVLVDAAEGPLPQTKFVVVEGAEARPEADRRHQQGRPPRRAHRPKSSTRCSTCSQRSTPPTSSSISRFSTARPSRAGWPTSPDGSHDVGMKPLFDLILSHVAPPVVEEGPFRLLGTILEANPYLGRIITGRIASGSVKPNQAVKVLIARRQADRDRPHHQDPGLPRHRAHADRTRPKPATSSPSPACPRPPSPTPSAIPRSKCRSRRSRSIRRPCR